MADDSAVEILRQLPTPHRNFLFDKYAKHLPDSRLVQVRLEALADHLGWKKVDQYANAYLHKGGLLSWWTFPDSDVSTKSVERALKKEYRGIEDGVEPALKKNQPPVLYSMKRDSDILILKLAAMDGERTFVTNWKYHTVYFDVTYIIVLRDDPFTIEVRSAYGKVQDLYHTVSSEISLRLDEGTECKLTTPALRSKLKRALESRCFYAQHRHADAEIAKSSLEAQPKKDLEAAGRLKEVEREPGVSGFTRWYDFEFEHEDGYVETCIYKVKLSNGQVRVGDDTSEAAIAFLEKNVVSLF